MHPVLHAPARSVGGFRCFGVCAHTLSDHNGRWYGGPQCERRLALGRVSAASSLPSGKLRTSHRSQARVSAACHIQARCDRSHDRDDTFRTGDGALALALPIIYLMGKVRGAANEKNKILTDELEAQNQASDFYKKMAEHETDAITDRPSLVNRLRNDGL